MNYREITPQDSLKPFIKCFYVFQSDAETAFEDVVFPSGFTEMIFNLGTGSWASYNGHEYVVTPKIEWWGQVTRPMQIQSKGKHFMLGVRFFPHSASYFLDEQMGQFNDSVVDLGAILGASVKALHERLLNTQDLIARIELIEGFLLKRLSADHKQHQKIEALSHMLQNINNNNDAAVSISKIASEHGISSRYLQKLVYQYTGLSPRSYSKINRFQLSLKLINKNQASLTSIAYDCGYFDQSHFIRDFKTFTGLTPSAYMEKRSPVSQVLLAG